MDGIEEIVGSLVLEALDAAGYEIVRKQEPPAAPGTIPARGANYEELVRITREAFREKRKP